MRYPREQLDASSDDGTMVENVDTLADALIGQCIVKVERHARVKDRWGYSKGGLRLTLDNGQSVSLIDTNDCCASTDLEDVIEHLDKIDHVILGVGTTGEFTRWHIYTALGDALELQVGWSAGNIGYYGYGFDILVTPEGAQT